MITADQLNELWSTYQNDVTSEVGHYISLAKIEHLMMPRINLGS